MKIKIKSNNQDLMYSDKELKKIILDQFENGELVIERPDKDESYIFFTVVSLEVECYGIGG